MMISISIDMHIMFISISMICVCHPPYVESSKNYLTSASNESYTIAHLIITNWYADHYINFDNTCGSSRIDIPVTHRS
jgi:hypothetical protein